MIATTNKEIFEFINLYKNLIEQVKKEELNPFEIDTYKLRNLVSNNIFTNGLIISLLSKLIKLKAEYLEKQLIPKTEEEKIKSVFKQVLQEETNLEDEDIEALLTVDSIKEKLKKPKSIKIERISYQEFQKLAKEQVKEVLYEDTDYNAYALEIAKQIEKGTFKIKNYKDFIGLMFAIYNFELEIESVEKFL